MRVHRHFSAQMDLRNNDSASDLAVLLDVNLHRVDLAREHVDESIHHRLDRLARLARRARVEHDEEPFDQEL